MIPNHLARCLFTTMTKEYSTRAYVSKKRVGNRPSALKPVKKNVQEAQEAEPRTPKMERSVTAQKVREEALQRSPCKRRPVMRLKPFVSNRQGTDYFRLIDAEGAPLRIPLVKERIPFDSKNFYGKEQMTVVPDLDSFPLDELHALVARSVPEGYKINSHFVLPAKSDAYHDEKAINVNIPQSFGS
jgi:hypothetical protein